jgi:nicotinamidase-related amidase
VERFERKALRMRTLNSETTALLFIDFQARLMRVIDGADDVIANAKRLLDAAALLGVPTLYTEQNPKGLGSTVEALTPPAGAPVITKMSFDACGADGFMAALGAKPDVLVAGCEAHVCVLQTVLSLIGAGRRVFVARDAIGSRRSESKETAIRRMERHGAEIVTTEMAIFEWLGTAAHPRFREASALVK